MRRTHAALAAVLALANIATARVAAADDARPLMTEVWSRLRALETERETLEILIVAAPDRELYRPTDLAALRGEGRRGVTRKRATRSIHYAADGADKLHIVFTEPREDRGTGFLVWRHPDAAQDDQWLYLPALKRVRRVPASSTQSFVGSNFTYEDVRHLTSEPLERYDYATAGEETIDGEPCALVRATPRPDAVSAYGERLIAIAKSSFFPVRTTFTAPNGDAWKRLTHLDVHEVAPKVWRPGLTEMRDLKLGETTVLVFPERRVNLPLDAALFTEDALSRWAGE